MVRVAQDFAALSAGRRPGQLRRARRRLAAAMRHRVPPHLDAELLLSRSTAAGGFRSQTNDGAFEPQLLPPALRAANGASGTRWAWRPRSRRQPARGSRATCHRSAIRRRRSMTSSWHHPGPDFLGKAPAHFTPETIRDACASGRGSLVPARALEDRGTRPLANGAIVENAAGVSAAQVSRSRPD